MTLHDRACYEDFIRGFKAATISEQWQAHVAKVGGKIFALFDRDGGEIWFKASDMAFRMLPELPHVRPAPYFARAGWVAVGPEAPISGDELETYLREAHALVAARLTRRVQAELGL